MAIQVALLRGINVAGHNAVAMADLRDFLADLGFSGAKSLLQSGNLVFRADRPSGAALERLLEREAAKRLGLSAEFVVRSAPEWAQIVAGNPFPREARDDPSHLVVVFLKSKPSAKDVETLKSAIKGREVVHGDGKQLFAVYPDGIGRSKLSGAVIERALGCQGTARNWNTILKILALCERP